MSEASETSRAHHYQGAFTDGETLLDLPVDFLFDTRLRLEIADAVLSTLVDPRSAQQRELLYLCGFFPHGVTATLLAQLLAPASTCVERDISALHQANLIQQREDLLFAPELVSAHAGKTLSREVRVELERRHALTCLLAGAFDPISCLQLVLPTQERARIEEQRDAFKQAISRTKSHNPRLAAELFLKFAHASFTHGRSEDLHFLEDTLPELLATLANTPDDEARVLLFHLHIAGGELIFRGSGASTPMFEALERARGLFPSLEAMPTHQRITYYYHRAIVGAFSQNDLSPYIEEGLVALALARNPDLPPFVEPQCLRMMARLVSHEPPRQRALDFARESMRLSRERGLEHLHPVCQMSCGLIYVRERDLDAALSLVEGLPTIFKEQQHDRAHQAAHILLATLYYSRGELAKALSLCTESRTHHEKHEDVHFERLALQLSALIELELGQHERALEQQRKLGWPLDPHTIEAYAISGVWLFGAGALVYHCAGDFFSAQRMWLDVEHYKARFGEQHPPEPIHDLIAFAYNTLETHADAHDEKPFSPHDQEVLTRHARAIIEDKDSHDLASLFKDGLMRFLQKRYFAQRDHHRLTLTIDAHQPTRFRVNDREPVDIQRRAAMRRILTALIEEHTSNALPVSISLEEIFALGWPGEQGTPDSVSARVYNTISRMRRMGLEEILVHDGEGYHLARDCEVRVDTP
ncbi:MAG: hypothetical protein VYE40_12210 [Myxococcota bacterium]|nr:hypothetical protein [Myxococcota bacterium]